MSSLSMHRATERNRDRLRRCLAHVVGWLGTCAGSYAAARAYEELRHLSNAELGRRGLSRATLAVDLLRNYERD